MGQLIEDPVIGSIAGLHAVTPSQVVLRWLTAQDRVVAIPRTHNLERLRENLLSLTIDLTADDLARINGLKSPDGRIVSPYFAPDWNT
jgi:2,5-diketo-D-gluconate reductase B